MARNELISLKLDIPDNLQSEEEIRRYIAQHLQRYAQRTKISAGQESEPTEPKSSHVSAGKLVEAPSAATRLEPQSRLDLEEQLRASRMQLARLHQRYNMVASRLQGVTRRKLLLRGIQRERARIESLERQLR